MNKVERFVLDRHKPVSQFVPVGATVDVHVRFREAGKDRTQIFSGVVLKVQGKKSTRSVTVRKIASGVGVERTFPLAAPAVQKMEVISRAKVRRGRLFYLRNLKGRLARLQTLNRASTSSEPGSSGKDNSGKAPSEKSKGA